MLDEPTPADHPNERRLARYRHVLTLTDRAVVLHRQRGGDQRTVHLQHVTSAALLERRTFQPVWGLVPVSFIALGVLTAQMLGEAGALAFGALLAWLALPLLRRGRGQTLRIGTPVDRIDVPVPQRGRKDAQRFLDRLETERRRLADDVVATAMMPTATPYGAGHAT